MNNKSNLRERMDVICSCGKKIGTIDRLESDSIKLAKSDPASDGQHHWVPYSWVDRVDRQVHLNRNYEEIQREWKGNSASVSSS